MSYSVIELWRQKTLLDVFAFSQQGHLDSVVAADKKTLEIIKFLQKNRKCIHCLPESIPVFEYETHVNMRNQK
jgi:hypothetical protein